MKTLIVYAGKYGCTAQAAALVAEQLTDVRLMDLDKERPDALDEYNTVIIGSAVYAGKIRKPVKDFCARWSDELIYKRLGLFLCCASAESAGKYYEENFHRFFLVHALERTVFGGELRQESMSFLEKKLIAAIGKKTRAEAPTLNPAEIQRFSAAMRL
jgi:Flavodoxin